MINQYIASWADIQSFLTKQNKAIFAPKKAGKSVVYKKFTPETFSAFSENDINLKSTTSAKNAVIPPSEVLFRFKATKDSQDLAKLHQELIVENNPEDAIIFASRPCDAKALQVLDLAYMGGQYLDPYYKAKREKLLVISKLCPKQGANCFCDLVGSSPLDNDGSDITFIKLSDSYLVNSITDKGEEAIKGSFKPADDKIKQEFAKLEAKTNKLADDTAKKLATKFDDLAFWQEVSAACLACGSCTYVCPTCQCFNITDEGDQYNGLRQRNWDSCMVNSFTREASGHNPRMEVAKRWRNRLNHKFNYFPSTYNNTYACVGCARCLVSCPVSINIKEMILKAIDGVQVEENKTKTTKQTGKNK